MAFRSGRRAPPGGCARSSPSRASPASSVSSSNGISHSSQKRRERSRISIRSGVRRRSTMASFGRVGRCGLERDARIERDGAARGVTSRGLTSSSAISGCAAIALPSATTARAAAVTSTAGRPRTPSSTAAVRSERSRRSAAAEIERRERERGVAQRLDQDPAQADQHDGAEARVARRADDELDAVRERRPCARRRAASGESRLVISSAAARSSRRPGSPTRTPPASDLCTSVASTALRVTG